MFWQLLLVAVVFGAVYYRWSRRRLYGLAKLIPAGPDQYPIVGHALKFIGSDEDRMDAFKLFGATANQNGGMATMWLGNRLFISGSRASVTRSFMTGPSTSMANENLSCDLRNNSDDNDSSDLDESQIDIAAKMHNIAIDEDSMAESGMTDPISIEAVSKACLDKDEFTMKFMRTAIGNGSVFAPAKIWHPRRKINSPFFSLKNLHRLIPVFNDNSCIMTKLMKTEVGGGNFSIWNYMTTFTFDSVFETACGMEMNSQENQEHYLLTTISAVGQMIASRMVQPWLHPNIIYHKLPVYKSFQNYMKGAISYLDKIVQEKRNEYTSIKSKDSKNINPEHAHFVNMVIQNSGGMEEGYSDMELREEIMVMIVAGTDTSAAGSSFTAVMLSRYPEVQEKVHKELQEVFGDSDRAVTAEDLHRLKYLEAVIKESLRLYPPVPVVVREIRSDFVLPSGITLVAGSSVLFNIYATHRNPAYWGEDADLFRPERFLEGTLKHPAQFIPFSYSVRNCIGSTYAMFSMKTSLANMLRRYRLLPPKGMRDADLTKPLAVTFEVMMKSVDGFQVRVEERNRRI